MLAHGQVLQEAGFDPRRQHVLPGGQRNLHVDERQRGVRGRDELLPLDHRQQVQDFLVQHVPRADLLFDHVESGFFEIHLAIPYQGQPLSFCAPAARCPRPDSLV
ncbi:hypothetical protein D3C81_1609310 [compost metagenome]